MPDFSKTVIFFGLTITALGVALYVFQKFGANSDIFGWLGNLPLDFKIEGERFRVYFPLGTSILLSVLLSLIFYIIRKLSE
ncbi:MAG: DUF2905 domain-containing protein [Chlorobiales bacterium]|jgi:hypothetical protein|nr:DUF2905 domain-containing protein [Chlorobiales bacterium]